MILSKIKSKGFAIGLGVMIAIGFAFWILWGQYNQSQENLTQAEEKITQLENSLQVSRNSFEVLRGEMRKQNELLERRRMERREAEQKLSELSEALEYERSQNPELEACWDVDAGDYAERLQSFSDRSSNRDENGED